MLEDFGGGASVEYLRKDERKDALGIRVEASGARRAETLKEEARVFIDVVVRVRRGGNVVSAAIRHLYFTVRHIRRPAALFSLQRAHSVLWYHSSGSIDYMSLTY